MPEPAAKVLRPGATLFKTPSFLQLLSFITTVPFAYFGLRHSLISPAGNLFIASKIGLAIEIGLSVLLATAAFWKVIKRFKAKVGRLPQPIRMIAFRASMFFLCAVVFFWAFQGAAELFTNMSADREQLFDVIKDPDTIKAVAEGHVRAYCLKSAAFEASFLSREYCDLKATDYTALSDPISITLITRQSFFGTVIVGYEMPNAMTSRTPKLDHVLIIMNASRV